MISAYACAVRRVIDCFWSGRSAIPPSAKAIARKLPLCCLIVLVSRSVDAVAAPKVPAGQWAVEYQEDTCTLSRDGLDGQPGIAVRTRPLAEPHDLMVYGQFGRGKEANFHGRIAIADQPESASRWMLVERAKGGKRMLLKTTMSAAELARLSKSGRLRIFGPDGFDLQLATTDMRKPLAALRECEVYLAGRWGITRAEMESWATPARPLEDLRELFWDKDMSKVAMMQSDSIRGVLTIDQAGTMIDCEIVQSTRIAWVNARFCPTLQARARFEPARDSSGAAVVGKVITPPIRSARIR